MTKDEITKDDNCYYCEGKRYHRVSRVISIHNNYDLDDFFKRNEFVTTEAYVDDRRDKGTEIHRLVAKIINENYVVGDDWWSIDISIRNGVKATLQAIKSLYIEPVHSEIKMLSDELGVGGTTDLLGKVTDPKYLPVGYWLFDWKSGSIFSPITKKIYQEIPIQGSTYFHMFSNEYPEIPLQGFCAVRTSQDTCEWTPKDMYPILAQDTKPHIKAFMNCLELYNYHIERYGFPKK